MWGSPCFPKQNQAKDFQMKIWKLWINVWIFCIMHIHTVLEKILKFKKSFILADIQKDGYLLVEFQQMQWHNCNYFIGAANNHYFLDTPNSVSTIEIMYQQR